MEQETLGERVRRLRKARGLSQDGLARQLGVTRQQVYQVERGDQQHMRKSTLQRYAQVLDVSERYLETGFEPFSGASDTSWPPLEVCLRHTSRLSEEDIAQVKRIIEALEARQELEHRRKLEGERDGA
ncbi:MAG: helix-turn-helix transcriptional regulator [Chloroflexi bacterium]|nr:helix-turn-helix transcriptional regulator [Chloroflexota bacterium]